jgi:hypothetical protein
MPETRKQSGKKVNVRRTQKRRKGGAFGLSFGPKTCDDLYRALNIYDNSKRVKQVKKIVTRDFLTSDRMCKLNDFLVHTMFDYGNPEIIKHFLDNGMDPNSITDSGESLLEHAVYINYEKIMETLIQRGARIHEKLLIRLTDTNYYIGDQVEKIKLLISLGLNVNTEIPNYKSLLHFAVRNQQKEFLRLLLEHGADKTIKNDKNQTPLELAEEVKAYIISSPRLWGPPLTSTIENIIKMLSASELPQRMFREWSRETIRNFNAIFENQEQANNFSLCPVCLDVDVTTVRESGCMYMNHKCNPAKRDPELYRKYSDVDGRICWCTICGRICQEHSHYPLVLARDPKPEALHRGLASPFSKDCRDLNGGGGLPEKYTRFDSVRLEMHAIQQLAGTITEKQAKKQLVDAYFNGPLRYKSQGDRDKVYNLAMRGISKSKLSPNESWKVPSNNFRLEKNLPVYDEDELIFPNIPYADADNAELQPVLHASGENLFTFESDVPVIQFRHRQKNGTINNHENEYIGKGMLISGVQTLYDDKKTKCFVGNCSANLHPYEVDKAFELLGASEETRELRAKYRKMYNAEHYESF